ncbi:MAG: hypothetical protein ACFFDI_05605 [Promethearchaeota archaeon]
MMDLELSKAVIRLLKTENVQKLKRNFQTVSSLIGPESEGYQAVLNLIQPIECSDAPFREPNFLEEIVNLLGKEMTNDIEPRMSLLLYLLQDEKPWIFDKMVHECCSLISKDPCVIFMLSIIQNQDLRRELIDHFPPEGVVNPCVQQFFLKLLQDSDSWVRGRIIDLLEPVIDDLEVQRNLLQVAKEDKDGWIRKRTKSLLQMLNRVNHQEE